MESKLELPELPPCPHHADKPPDVLASCRICWGRFYIPWEYGVKLQRINRAVNDHLRLVERAKQSIALRDEGFEIDGRPPKDTAVVFALGDGGRVEGREIDDGMGGTYPVKLDAGETPIRSYAGWKRA